MNKVEYLSHITLPSRLSQTISDAVSIKTSICRTSLTTPIVSKPTNSKSDNRLSIVADSIGMLGCMPKGYTLDELGKIATQCSYMSKDIAFGVPIDQFMLEYVSILTQMGLGNMIMNLKNGHNLHLGNAIKKVKSTFPSASVIAGNAFTLEAFKYLVDCGADCVILGLGELPITARPLYQTDIGKLLLECREYSDVDIIIDHNISQPSDFVKLIALGASAVSFSFEGFEEAGGQYVDIDNQSHRAYLKRDEFGTNLNKINIVKSKGSMSDFSSSYTRILKQAIAFLDCSNVVEFREYTKDKLSI